MFKKLLLKGLPLTITGIIVAMVIGFFFKSIIPYAFFKFPAIVVVVFAFWALASLGKPYKYVSIGIAIVLLWVLLVPGIIGHYSLIAYAIGTRDIRTEIDAADKIRSPFAKSIKKFREYENRVDEKTADKTGQQILKDGNEVGTEEEWEKAFNDLSTEAGKYKNRKEKLNKLEDSLLTDKPKEVVQQNSFQYYQDLKSKNPAEDVIQFDGSNKLISRMYTFPGDDFVLTTTGLCYIENPEGKLDPLEPGQYNYRASCYGFIVIWKGEKGGQATLRPR